MPNVEVRPFPRDDRDMQVDRQDDGAETAAVEVRDLVKRYRRGFLRPLRAVLDGVDLRVEAGETVALVGPNGSGKSTLLRILSGIEDYDGGKVQIFGGPPAGRAARAAVGEMGPVESLPPELRAGEALELLGGIAGLTPSELRSASSQALERVGLGKEGRTTLGRFSLGMKRRFSLAAATFTTPALLLLDEPSAGLDAPGHAVLTELVRDACARGAAVLFASHQLDDLAAFADRIVVLVDGQVIASGTPLDLVSQTQSGRLELDGIDADGLARLSELAKESSFQVTGRGPGRAALARLFVDRARSAQGIEQP
ncbi:MAG: ABC-2 type transport system ATP-binding protein [Planctomycetota bacterium]